MVIDDAGYARSNTSTLQAVCGQKFEKKDMKALGHTYLYGLLDPRWKRYTQAKA